MRHLQIFVLGTVHFVLAWRRRSLLRLLDGLAQMKSPRSVFGLVADGYQKLRNRCMQRLSNNPDFNLERSDGRPATAIDI